MTPSEVRRIVESEIGDEWSRTNAHGCNLARCIVEPTLKEYENCFDSGLIKLWVVLEEDPENLDGYQIVFDEHSRMFGLACLGNQGPIYLGPYGDFLTTYDAM